MGKYRRVTYEDRCHIFEALNRGLSKSEISRILGFNKSTIYREIHRCWKQKTYSPSLAQVHSAELRKSCCRRLKIIGASEDLVQYFLFEGWTPEEISGRLKQEQVISFSKSTVYNFLNHRRKDLKVLLKRYNRRGAGRFLLRKMSSSGKLSVRERSERINQRRQLGDFERDCMRFSQIKQEILVCSDRKSRYVKLALAPSQSPKLISHLTESLIGLDRLRSLTNDNGLEFRDGTNMSCPVYYCDPGRPEQRGTIENTIGRLRHYLPRKIDPREMDLANIEDKYNLTPRKCLGYRTPYEVYHRKRVALAT